MCRVYRIVDTSGILGCVVATSKRVADAYALGRYGPSASAIRVAHESAVEAFGVCILIETKEKRVESSSTLRVIQ